MAQPNNKVPDYIVQRVAGLPPKEAALAAGYAQSGASVTACRLEAREDVRAALRVAKRGGGVGKKPVHSLKSPTSKRQYRSVADEPQDDDLPPELEPWRLKDKYDTPLDLLIDVMNNKKAPGGLRIQCAKDAMPYCHARKEPSKKEDNANKAKSTAAKSKFGTQARPSHLRQVA